MGTSDILLKVLDIANVAVKAGIIGIVAFVVIKYAIISAVIELKKRKIL